MRERTVTISSGRQDVLVHRLEDRLGLRSARRSQRGPNCEAVPHLRERRPVPVRRSPSAWLCPTSTTPGSRADCSRSATGSAPGWPTPASTCSARRYVLRHATSTVGTPTGSSSAVRCPARCGVVAVPNSVFYDTHDRRSLVRFAFCKRLDVLEEASSTRLKGDVGREGRRDPARHRLGGPRQRTSQRLAPLIAQAAARGRAAGRAHRDVRHGLLDEPGADRRARRRPERAVPRRPGRASTAPGCAARSRSGRPGADRPFNQLVLAGPDGTCTVTRRSTRSATPASTSTTRPATDFRDGRHRGLRVSLFVCYDLRFADVFWDVRRRHRLLRRRRQLARAACTLAGAPARPGHREPGVRGRA